MKNTLQLRPLTAALLLLVGSQPGFAQDTTPDTTALGEVVVSGSREATPLAETPASIGKVDEKTLQNTKATNITQAVNSGPGRAYGGLR